MNDVQLVRNDATTFDWNFENGDVCDVIGDQQLIASVIHSISSPLDELEQEVYQGTGNIFQNLIKSGASLEEIRSEIIEECKKTEGVYDAEVELMKNNETIIIQKITLIKENGGLVDVAITE